MATEAGGQKQRRECWGAEEIRSKAVMQASGHEVLFYSECDGKPLKTCVFTGLV